MKRWLLKVVCLLACILIPAAAVLAEEQTERLPDEVLMQYYNNSLFVGDSVMRMFRNHVKDTQKTNPDYFSGIKFYSAYNYTMRVMTRENIGSGTEEVQLTYQGKKATLREIMQKEKPDRVFIMIGLNDRIYAHLDRADMYINRLMEIREKYVPDVQICFFSLTPVTRKVGKKNRDLIDAYNVWLADKCADVGALYIDVSSGIRDADGWLPDNMSSDGQYHMGARGNGLWAQAMLDFAQEQYEAGMWSPVVKTE